MVDGGKEGEKYAAVSGQLCRHGVCKFISQGAREGTTGLANATACSRLHPASAMGQQEIHWGRFAVSKTGAEGSMPGSFQVRYLDR